jgi:type II secretory pathway pseudopilin PulG
MSHKSRQRGASFLEIIIAVAIVGAVFSAIAAGLTFAQKVSIASRHLGFAKEAAQSDIEEVRRTSFEALPTGATNEDLSQTLPQGSLERIVDYFDPPTNKVKKVTVTVTWQEAGVTRTVSLETLVSAGGIGG